MKNPIIGITLDYEINGGYSKFPWYAIRENYLTCLHKFGAIPFGAITSPLLIGSFFEANSVIIPADLPTAIRKILSNCLRSIVEFTSWILFL